MQEASPCLLIRRHRSLRRRSAFTTALSIVAWKGDGPWTNAEGVSQTPWMYWAATFQRSSQRVSCHGKNLRNRPSPKCLHFFDFCRETLLRNACRHSFPRIAECIASTRTGSVGGVSSRRLETIELFYSNLVFLLFPNTTRNSAGSVPQRFARLWRFYQHHSAGCSPLLSRTWACWRSSWVGSFCQDVEVWKTCWKGGKTLWHPRVWRIWGE